MQTKMHTVDTEKHNKITCFLIASLLWLQWKKKKKLNLLSFCLATLPGFSFFICQSGTQNPEPTLWLGMLADVIMDKCSGFRVPDSLCQPYVFFFFFFNVQISLLLFICFTKRQQLLSNCEFWTILNIGRKNIKSEQSDSHNSKRDNIKYNRSRTSIHSSFSINNMIFFKNIEINISPNPSRYQNIYQINLPSSQEIQTP